MLEHKPQWSYSLDQETCWTTYDTKEEAIAAGIEDAKAEGCPTVYVGECEFYYPEIDEDNLLDTIREKAWESEFGEYSEGWLENTTIQEDRKLGRMLNDAFHEWLRQTGNVPKFFIANLSEEIDVDDDD